MLSAEEKRHVKEILSDGLGINKDINLAYFLSQILETSRNVEEVMSRIKKIEYNQKAIEEKLDMIIRLIRG